MNIEDLIIKLFLSCKLSTFDDKVASNFYDQLCRNIGFTEKQRKLALTILDRYKTQLSVAAGRDVSQYLSNPVYKFPVRQLNTMKRMSIIPSETYGKVLKVEFPYNEEIVKKINDKKRDFVHAEWNADQKSWLFALNERVLPLVTDLVVDYGFTPDEELGNYIEEFVTIRENLEKYVPMVSYDGEIPKFLNASKHIPQPTSSDVVETLFTARKSGILTWDEKVSSKLECQKVSKVVLDFLNESPSATFTINLEENSFSDVVDLVKFIGPTVFVIPGGSEFEKTTNTVQHLLESGVKSEEISVLFRLPKETGAKFNEFVKEQQLNNPVSEKTRAVFISGKVPKPMITSGVRFESVVNFSIYSVHYTLRDFIKNHHNVIHVMDKNTQRNFNFASL